MKSICGKCFSDISDDASYCEECGAKTLFFDDDKYSSDTMPVAILWKTVFLEQGMPYIRLSIYNKSEKTIVACKVVVTCKDPFGDDVGDTIIKFIDLNVHKNQMFGSEKNYRALSADARLFQFAIDQVIFDDGEIWHNDNSMKICDLIIEDESDEEDDVENNDNSIEKTIDMSFFEDLYDELVREGIKYYDDCQNVIDIYNDEDDLDDKNDLINQLSENYIMFVGEKLEGIDEFIIPDYITEISNNYFLGMYSEYDSSEFSSEAEEYLEKLLGLTIILPQNLKKVGKYSLYQLRLKNIPETLNYVDENAFSGAEITEEIDLVFPDLMYVGEHAFSHMSFVDGYIPNIRIYKSDIDIGFCGFSIHSRINELEFPSNMKPIGLFEIVGDSLIDKIILDGGLSNNYIIDNKGNVFYNYEGDMVPFWYSKCINNQVLTVYSDYRHVLGIGEYDDRYNVLNYMKSYYTDAIDIGACNNSMYESVELIKWKCASRKNYWGRFEGFASSIVWHRFPNVKAIKVIEGAAYGDFSYSQLDSKDFDFTDEKGIAIINDSSSDEYIIKCLDMISNEKRMITEKHKNNELSMSDIINQAKQVQRKIDEMSRLSSYVSDNILDAYALYLASYEFYLEKLDSIKFDDEADQLMKNDTDYNAEEHYGEYDTSSYIPEITTKKVTPYLKRMLQSN